MDSAYFVGRKELLDFFNTLLDLNLSKIEQTASGAIACQLTELIFEGSIPLAKINWEARSDYEFVQNYKLLQKAFTKHRVQRHVDVDKLIRAKYQDNLEFCQWLKAFYDHSGVFREDYDPKAARAKGKGGSRYNSQMSSKPVKSASRAPRPTVSRPTKPAVSSTKSTTKPTVPPRTTAAPVAAASATTSKERPSRPLRERAPENAKPDPRIAELEQANATMQAKNEELTQQLETQAADAEAKVIDLEQAILEIEKERDFYFEKLRNVEVLLQVHQESHGEDDPVMRDIFRLLYAEAEDNLIVTEDGQVVEGEPVEGEDEALEE